MAIIGSSGASAVLGIRDARYPQPRSRGSVASPSMRQRGRGLAELLIRHIFDHILVVGAKDESAEKIYLKYSLSGAEEADFPRRLFLPSASIRA